MFVVRMRTLCIAVVLIMLVALVCTTVAILRYDKSSVESFSGNKACEVPIIMYHSLTDKSSLVNTYTVLGSEFEKDLVYLKNNGYTTVFFSDIIDYVDGKSDLPEKPIVLTFDDGFRNNLTIGLELLKKYDMKATVSVVGSYTDNAESSDDKNPDYAYLDKSDIRTLKDSGLVEIANHSYNMHMLPGTKGNVDSRRGVSQKSSEDNDAYITKLKEDVEKNWDLIKEICGTDANVFTYPYGELCKNSEAALKDMGYRVTLSCLEKTNYISEGNSDSLYCMCRFLRSDKKSVEEIIKGGS